MTFQNIPVAILAGGLGTRLRPLTETVPKVMLPVAGRPFLAHQIELLLKQGVQRAVLCVGYLGNLIQDKFGDGSAYGIRLDYSFDGPKLLGTGGAIKAAIPKLGNTFFVMYGDSYLPIDFRQVEDSFQQSGKLGLMTVYRNLDLYDKSNVTLQGGEIIHYEKNSTAMEMQHIDYGLSCFRSESFSAWSSEQTFDLSIVFQTLILRKQLAGMEVHQRFYEVGSPAGLSELERFLGISSAVKAEERVAPTEPRIQAS